MGRPPVPASTIADACARITGTDKYDVKPETRRRYAEIGRLLIEFFGHDIDLTTMTRQDYRDWHDWLLTRGTRLTTVNSYRRRARAVWNRLRRRGYDVVDIDGLTKLEKAPIPTGKAINDDHLGWLLNIANIRDAAMILYTAQAGFRRQTLTKLRVSETKIWQGPEGRWRIATNIPEEKTSAPRTVFGGHEAALAVMLWLEIRQHDSDYLFNSLVTGEPLTVHGISTVMEKLKRRSNLPEDANTFWHALRHRFAQMKLTDHDAAIVAQWMGITVDTVLQVYATRSVEDLEAIYYGDN